MSTKSYYVYILTNYTKTVLYTGMTNNLERRVFEHKQKLNARSFTRKYQVNLLMWFESHSDVNEAIRREKLIKKWKRKWKVDLIKYENPEWNDLAREWYK